MKVKFNPKNERIKKKYFSYLMEAKQLSASTVDSIRKAIHRYEDFNAYEDIGKFSKDKAMKFKKALIETKNKAKAEPLSKSTILHTLNPLKDFFKWLAYLEGYRSKIKLPDIEYFNLSEKDTREAKASGFKDYPTTEQIKKAIFYVTPQNEIQMRDQALIAFTFLTGIRDGAIITLKLKHMEVDKKLVVQDPREVKTKFSKMIDTYFFPVGEDIERIVLNWIKYLREVKLYGDNEPLFPKTLMIISEEKTFVAAGISNQHWQSVGPMRDIFKQTFENAGLKYYTPHTFRNTLVQLGEKICTSPEEFKAWSQNLGHESPLTTFISYGQVSTHRQGELIKNVGKGKKEDGVSHDLLQKIWSKLDKD